MTEDFAPPVPDTNGSLSDGSTTTLASAPRSTAKKPVRETNDRRADAVRRVPILRRIRVLHVLRAMNRGGIETWLMHALRHIDRDRFQMEFLVGTREPADYDDEIRSLGCRILPIARPHPRHPWRAAREFMRVLKKQGPYDVVHAHEQEMGGFYLRYAARVGVPLRIAHSHNDTMRSPGYRPSLGNRWRASIMRHWIHRHATHGLACSRLAAEAVFGPRWERDARFQVFPYGIDLEPFGRSVDRDAVRAEFGIGPHDLVIGHVGRLDAQKNHSFLLDIVGELAARQCPVKLLLLGEGPKRGIIEEKVRSAGLSGRAIFAGVRGDVPRVMLGAMDVFVLPSHFEGLGIVLLEAQAAGLPCVASDRVPAEARLEKTPFQSLSLDRTAAEWANAVLNARSARSDRETARQSLRANGFDIRVNICHLENLYADACTQPR